MESARQGTFDPTVEIRQRMEIARKALGRWTRRLRGTMERMEPPEAALAAAARIELLARTLLAHLSSIPKGATSAALPDYGGDGTGTVVVELDPALPARACAERMLRESRKMRRGAQMVPVRLAALESELAEAAEWTRRLEDAAAAERKPIAAITRVLDELEARLLPRGLWPTPPRTRDKEAVPNAPVRWKLDDGWILMAGRSGTENDILTTRIARPDDLWFHVANVPGAHVVLRSPDGRSATPPLQLVERAASLAAWLSRLRAQECVEVRYTERKRVRKPRKAPAGSVVMDQSRSILVKPAPPPRTL